MKARFSIFLATISLVVIMMLSHKSRSCGPELAPDEVRFALFRPEVTGDPGLNDFHYTHNYLNGWAEADTDYRRNCKEWQLFTHNAASLHDIYEIQYKVSPDEFVYAYNSGNWDNLRENNFVQWLLKKENAAALNYMVTAKKIEFNQNSFLNDPWGDKTPNHAEIVGDYELKEQLEKPLPAFLKERYAFQCCKLMYFFNNPGEFKYRPDVIAFYDKYLSGRQTIVADWALVYYALSQPNRQLRNLYMLRTFDRSDSKKHYAYQWLSSNDMDTLEATATDKKDRLMAHVMKTLMNSSRTLPDIQYIYKQDPRNRYLPLLITREINKLEDWIWSPEILKFEPALKAGAYTHTEHSGKQGTVETDTAYTYYRQKNVQKDRAYLKEVLNYLQFMLNQGRVNTDFLGLSIAHLYNMDKNYSAANMYLQHIKHPQNPYYGKQLAIERLIVLTGTADIADDGVKQEIYDNIKEIENAGLRFRRDTEEDYENFSEQDDDLGELMVMLSRLYQAKGDMVTADLLLQKSRVTTNEYAGYCTDTPCYARIAFLDRYGQPADVDKALALKHKQNKTPFETYIATELTTPDVFYLDLKATMLVRDEKFHEALAVLNPVNDSFWIKTYEYKHYLPKTHIGNLGTLLPVPSGPTTRYAFKSKKLVIKDLAGLQDAVKRASTDKEKANACFLMANGLFNITYDGKGWMMYSYGKSSHDGWWYNEDWVYYNFKSDDWHKMEAYYNYADAIAAYREALGYARKIGDDELAAKCLVMLGYCDVHARQNQNSFARNGIRYSQPDHAYNSPYLQMLVKNYSDTKTYDYSVGYCPDVQ